MAFFAEAECDDDIDPERAELCAQAVHDEQTVICKNLFQPGTDMNLFLGMTVQLGESGPCGSRTTPKRALS